MKKLSVLLISFMILGATNLSASITRDAGMGLSEVPWMLDGLQGMVYINPAYAADFKNRVFFDRTGWQDGLNSGGLFWNPVVGLTVGMVSGIAVKDALWNSTAAQGFYYQGNFTSNANGAQSFDVTSTIGGEKLHLMDPDPSDEDYKRINLDQQAFRIFTAYDFGKIKAGGSFGFASGWKENSYTQDASNVDSYTLSEVEYDTVLGGVFEITDTMDLGVDLNFKYYDLENSYDRLDSSDDYKITYKSNAAMDIYAGVSYNIKVGSMQKIHTRVQYGFLNRSTIANFLDRSEDPDESLNEEFQRLGHEIRLGVSDELTINKNITVFVGINAVYSLFTYKAVGTSDLLTVLNYASGDVDSDRYNGDATTVQIPFYVGLELRPHKNFEFRVGLSHVIYNLTMIDSSFSDDGGTPSEWSDTINNSNTTEMTLGLTWKFYDVRLEWVLNVDMFTRGPDFISGYSAQKAPNNVETGTTPIATSFAISYDFNHLWDKVVAKDK